MRVRGAAALPRRGHDTAHATAKTERAKNTRVTGKTLDTLAFSRQPSEMIITFDLRPSPKLSQNPL
jgi:hypothetical protein